MQRRATSKKRAAETEEEINVEEKEVSSVEEIEMTGKEEASGGPDWNKFMEQMMNSMAEKFDKMDEKLDKNKEETRKDFKRLEENNKPVSYTHLYCVSARVCIRL